ncbi:hypothetical protein ST37_02545 [Vibrio sp. qd031]|uniref:FG-GAP repeat domain-containing protein n=1 Tax=Vibrio sp. qd031 TaxID=1603038 RepID=UPI000A1212EC|nr:VCBS repeat-containing protein [Vibrio sp. qd031]ORT52231.1 hypothetical protein ST37_02545 [Vibrio sp. qd031]
MNYKSIFTASMVIIGLVACGDSDNESDNRGSISYDIPRNSAVNRTTSYAIEDDSPRIDRRFGLSGDDTGEYFYSGAVYADFNLDGFTDLVLSGSNGRSKKRARYFVNDGNGNYVEHPDYIIGGSGLIHPRKSIAGDFDGNGYLDVINFATGEDWEPFPGEVSDMYLNTGNELVFSDSLSSFIGYHHCGASADIDADGDIDVLMGDANNDGMYFLINDGKANFEPAKNRIVDSGETYRRAFTCELYDVNDDGYVDIIKGGHDFEGSDSEILYGSASGIYDKREVIPPVDYMGVVLDINFADINNDGFIDILVSRTGASTPASQIPELLYSGYYLQLLLGSDSGFIEQDTIENSSDIALVSRGNNDSITYFLRWPVYKGTQERISWNNHEEWVDWMRIQDVNGDGFLDIVEEESSTGRTWLNDGSGNFSSEFDLLAVPDEYSVVKLLGQQ